MAARGDALSGVAMRCEATRQGLVLVMLISEELRTLRCVEARGEAVRRVAWRQGLVLVMLSSEELRTLR